MPTNYNPATGLPYTRVESIHIEFRPDRADVTILEGESIVAGGQVRRLDAVPRVLTFSLPLDADGLAASFPRRDFETGEVTTGNVTVGEVVVGMLAVIRAKQIANDT
jgi:hypothetical protein